MSYPYQNRSPLEGILRGLQIRQMVEDIKARREARAQQAQLHQLEIEQHQQRHAADQFNMTMMLRNLGAIPAASNDTGQNDEALAVAADITPENRRRMVNTPVGNYRLPSETDTFTRSKRRAAQTGSLKGIEKSAEEDLTNPMTTMEVQNPEIESGAFSQGTMQVRQKAKESIWEARQKRIAPNANITNSWDDAGNLTKIATDPRTNKVINILKVPRVGRTTRPVGAAGGKKTLSQINLEADQEVIDKVFGGKTEIPNPTYEAVVKDAAEKRVASGDSRNLQEADWYFRTQDDGRAELMATHPSLFTNSGELKQPTVNVRKTPQYQDALRKAKLSRLNSAATRPGSMTGQSTASAVDEINRVAKLGKPMPAKNVTAAAQGLGITEEEFSRLWHAAGGTIAP